MSKSKAVLRRAIASAIRNRSFQIPRSIREKDLLDIGCGASTHEGFICIDYKWHRKLDICWDITKGLPLDSASVSGVFSEHCLEHLALPSGDELLREMYRVLKPNGTLRLIVPDGELYMRRYVQALEGKGSESLPYAERDPYHGIYQPIMSVNRIFHEHGHRFIYDFATLSALLSRHGFVGIERSAFGVSRDPRLLNDTERRAHESLYVEATKPPTTS